jgi:hypothetical protein
MTEDTTYVDQGYTVNRFISSMLLDYAAKGKLRGSSTVAVIEEDVIDGEEPNDYEDDQDEDFSGPDDHSTDDEDEAYDAEPDPFDITDEREIE